MKRPPSQETVTVALHQVLVSWRRTANLFREHCKNVFNGGQPLRYLTDIGVHSANCKLYLLKQFGVKEKRLGQITLQVKGINVLIIRLGGVIGMVRNMVSNQCLGGARPAAFLLR